MGFDSLHVMTDMVFLSLPGNDGIVVVWKVKLSFDCHKTKNSVRERERIYERKDNITTAYNRWWIPKIKSYTKSTWSARPTQTFVPC